MGAGTSAGKGVLIHGALAPHALTAQVQDVLRPVPERRIALLLVDTGIMSSFQGVVHGHQFLGAGSHGIAHAALLIPPDAGLHPCVHIPAVARVPNIVYAEALSLFGENAGGVGIVIGHHGFHGGVGDGPLAAPGLALQAAAHAAALGAAEADGVLASIFEGHFMKGAAPQGGGLVRHAGVAELLQRDGVAGGEGRRGEQAQGTDQRQQQSRQARSQMVILLFHRQKLFLSFVFGNEKSPSAS